MIKSGKSFSNCKVIASDPILRPLFNKDIGLHFLAYFADTSFYSLAIKSIYHQYSYQLEKNDEIVHIPSCTFLVRFGGISGEFARAMVRILARRSRAKIPMARPNEPEKKKIRLGIYLYPNSAQNLALR